MSNELDFPLKAEVKNGKLVIEIGIDTLAFCFEENESNNPYDPERDEFIRVDYVCDSEQFARDVCNAMNDESETGATPLTDFLDKMCFAAADDGSLGIKERH